MSEAGRVREAGEHAWARVPAVHTIGAGAPFRWLARGWGDFRATRYRGAFYGALFVAMGLLIELVYATRWQLTMALTAGFFLVGPFVCTGIYELSRQRERGEPVDLGASMGCFTRNLGGIAFFAAVLTFAMIVWARVSVVLFALFSTAEFPTMQSMILQVITLSNLEFVLVWVGVGFVFASLVFAITVVSIPLLLDRAGDTMMAIFASARALYLNPAPLYLWAALIVALIGASLALWFVPLVVTAPLIGHATWHAYRDLIEIDRATEHEA
ncbi:MAG TPA: DUF2189 domain-containing protein [Burkholderiaceae bacterium]